MGIKALGGDDIQLIEILVPHQNRCTAYLHHSTHLADDGSCGLFESDGVAEDLADGIEQINLGIPDVQFLPEALGLPLTGQQPLEEGSHECRTRCGGGSRPITGNFQPETNALGNRHEPARTIRRRACALGQIPVQGPARILPSDEPRRAGQGNPKPKTRLGEVTDQFENGGQPPYQRGKVIQIVFPFVLNATWSAR